MATIQSTAIIARIREVLEEGRGVLRAISSTRFDADFPEGLDRSEELRRALTGPRVRVMFPGLERSKASPPVKGSLLIYELPVTVQVTRTITPLEQLSDDDADAIQALALDDCDIIRQALEFPENLRGTTAYVTGVGGAFGAPYTTAALAFTIDGVSVSAPITTDPGSDVTTVVATIAAALTGAGISGSAASVVDGQIRITSQTGGSDSSVVITSGAMATQLGLAGLSSTGVSCDLASGMLSWVSSQIRTDGAINDGAQRLISTHQFIGRAFSRPATS